MAQELQLGTDINGKTDFSTNICEINYKINMPQNTEKSFTLPEYPSKWKIIFRYTPGAAILVNSVSSATVPTTDFQVGGDTLNPAGYNFVNGGTTLSFITEDANTPTITASCYGIANI